MCYWFLLCPIPSTPHPHPHMSNNRHIFMRMLPQLESCLHHLSAHPPCGIYKYQQSAPPCTKWACFSMRMLPQLGSCLHHLSAHPPRGIYKYQHSALCTQWACFPCECCRTGILPLRTHHVLFTNNNTVQRAHSGHAFPCACCRNKYLVYTISAAHPPRGIYKYNNTCVAALCACSKSCCLNKHFY
jgi:hypothetical protein